MLCRLRLYGPAILFVVSTGVASAGDDFSLAKDRVGRLVIGMPENAIYNVYPRRITRKVDLQLEGMPTPAIQIFLSESRRKPSLVIRLDGPEAIIYGIEVTDSRFKTAGGVGVGSSLGQLRRAQKHLSFVGGEGITGAAAEDLNMTFDLLIERRVETRLFDPGNPDKDVLSRIPNDTRIKSVWIYRAPNPIRSR